ncbi:negative regulator of flagellin synthesis FlgM [Novosphingobium hassiacum]|uniref:Negative regulator of flagellin synthesis n=1 Tax=Novosphingobium hassiacum TaxID=173676 RepID=A0A7W6EXI1_9SPHN|nr:flagellar biosynthesis anti-sigma factor FlgM [Novosphingobium hassiacum]MBB3861874.1 negative regulator of flagellin synthesis FlgM [Novosphingobium hassiacum]
MSPFEIGASRPVGAVQVKPAATPAPVVAKVETQGPAVTDAGSAAQVERSSALDAGAKPPVDAERVQVIRQAIERGTYPVVPAKIADAMIAAGMLLRNAS